MSSPDLDVIAKRRYHKHRKTRKKSSLSQEALSKVILHPKISKRLTGGFCFRGAVVTSSHSRNSKGVSAIKKRKSSTDYDLHCLLKAAKSKVVSDHSQSPSTGISTADDIDDPVENYPDNNYKQKPSQQPTSRKEIDVDTETSSGNRVPFGHEEQDPEPTMQFERVTMKKKANNSDHLCKGCHNVSSDKDHNNVDLNYSSENSTSHTKPKPHISSYQKFAVGIVEALISEKKKQFPNLGLSKQIKLELNNIYQRTKNAADKSKEVTTCLQMPQDLYLNLSKSELNCQLVSQTRKGNPGMADNKYEMGQKSFKERTVEAWVEAIPQGPTESNVILNTCQQTKLKWERCSKQFERDFLENVKKEQNVSKPNPYTSKKGIPTIWFTDEVKSPSFSPFLAKEKKAVLGHMTLPQNDSQESQRNKVNSMKLNFHLPVEKDGLRQNPLKAQQSWTSWFKGNDDIVERRQPDSPICSPLFTFDPPAYKRAWVAFKEDSTDTKHPTRKVEDKSSVWSQFPKLMKMDQRRVSNIKGIHGQKEMMAIYNQNESSLKVNTETSNKSPTYIQFSPRKMF